MRLVAWFGIVFALVGCNKARDLSNMFDMVSFRFTGGTLFSNPNQKTMKEIHLDKGVLLGKDVVVEGHVAEVGRFLTYAVLSDDTARLLVLLTDLDSVEFLTGTHNARQKLKILGSVENGKKGLPFIQARAITVVAR